MSQLRTELVSSRVGALQQRADGWHQVFRLAETFAGFEGHFPDNPVVPAVVQLLMGALVAEAVAGRTLTVVQVAKAKFLHPLRPLEDINLRCVPDPDDALRCQIQLTGAAGTAAVFRLQLKETGGSADQRTTP
jgi:3-hydroxyacyl-[acyl-carrier-protein] dehydratase